MKSMNTSSNGKDVYEMESYKVKLPRQIRIGDPWYYEQFSGEKLDSLVIDINPPEDFETRVVLTDDGDTCSLQFCLAPKNFLKIYMQGKMLAYQQYDSKCIAVDTAKFRLAIDDRSDMVYTGGDGLWGDLPRRLRKARRGWLSHHAGYA